MPAGEYWIGDLCYAMHNEWTEFCDLTIKGREVFDGKFALKDGREFVFFGTAYGDGEYPDTEGRTYCVDAGLIGAIKVDDITENERNTLELGHIVHFATDWKAEDANGVLFFGDVRIDTAFAYDEEDEEYEE
jgi:hypothetical protein